MCLSSEYIEEQRKLDAERDEEIHEIRSSIKEILDCIKGKPELGIDGLVPIQKQLEEQLSIVKSNLSEVTKTTTDIEAKMKSFENIRITFEMLSNKSALKILIKILLIFCGIMVLLKLGATKIFVYIKEALEALD